ncbi:MAG: hypothetical protein OEV42_01555 [Deltaproteobacteria bacterium]|nr:hypothetical protein [Deltaproteobacteria bacterium]
MDRAVAAPMTGSAGINIVPHHPWDVPGKPEKTEGNPKGAQRHHSLIKREKKQQARYS